MYFEDTEALARLPQYTCRVTQEAIEKSCLEGHPWSRSREDATDILFLQILCQIKGQLRQLHEEVISSG
jgi:hypothetical protein